ncbi:unnamed protein product [Linum trigynum]|uniref:Uncharacterized protein n=1 Tax=Linum trigynum TaxID=586398 RepID=A0AAV2FWY1_9ROSI
MGKASYHRTAVGRRGPIIAVHHGLPMAVVFADSSVFLFGQQQPIDRPCRSSATANFIVPPRPTSNRTHSCRFGG